jgi:hypothetical protein
VTLRRAPVRPRDRADRVRRLRCATVGQSCLRQTSPTQRGTMPRRPCARRTSTSSSRGGQSRSRSGSSVSSTPRSGFTMTSRRNGKSAHGAGLLRVGTRISETARGCRSQLLPRRNSRGSSSFQGCSGFYSRVEGGLNATLAQNPLDRSRSGCSGDHRDPRRRVWRRR